MEQLPPPPVPLRPDLAPPDLDLRAAPVPRWVVAVCVLLALSMGALAVAPLFEGTEGTDETGGPGFLFLDRTEQGTPTRWNPCDPIHYVVNATLAPPGSIEDVHEAVRRVSAATGIDVRLRGDHRRGVDDLPGGVPAGPIRGPLGARPHRMGGPGRLGHPVRARRPRRGRRRRAGRSRPRGSRTST